MFVSFGFVFFSCVCAFFVSFMFSRVGFSSRAGFKVFRFLWKLGLGFVGLGEVGDLRIENFELGRVYSGRLLDFFGRFDVWVLVVIWSRFWGFSSFGCFLYLEYS